MPLYAIVGVIYIIHHSLVMRQAIPVLHLHWTITTDHISSIIGEEKV
uniref:Uncharacterized protein n=1 Tax=Saccharum hybrid cultivar S.251/08 TaxID=1381932 RepID=U5QR53_9POAL|nr:hypothetical protein [Saccharum hybrid cultivar S.251/08]